MSDEMITLSVLTVLRTGQHLAWQTRLPPEYDPQLAADTHVLVRNHHHAGDVARFVVVAGDHVSTRTPGEED